MLKKIILTLMLVSNLLLISENKPPWLKMRPVSQEYYLGIGMALKDKPNYRDIATLNALNNLASEIEITISGEIISMVLETSFKVEEQLKSEISASTRAQLSDYELIASWQDKQQYWVYYRLSKSVYQANRRKKIDQVSSLALDFFLSAQENELSHEYSLAISNYLQALQAIEAYLSEPLSIDYGKQRIFLNNEIFIALQTLLSRIELLNQEKSYSGKIGKPLQKPIWIKALYQNGSDSKPVSHLPLTFKFIKGNAELVPNATTASNGMAKAPLGRITSSEKIQILQCEVDLSSLITADSTSYLLRSFIQKLPIPKVRVALNILELTIFMESEERVLGDLEKIKYLEPQLKASLADSGFNFSEDISQADFLITLKAVTKPGSELYGMFSVFASANISVIDLASGNEIYKTSLSKVKGIDLDEEKAGRKALENCSARLFKQILPVLQGE